MCVCVCVHARVCVFMCVYERERMREKDLILLFHLTDIFMMTDWAVLESQSRHLIQISCTYVSRQDSNYSVIPHYS